MTKKNHLPYVIIIIFMAALGLLLINNGAYQKTKTLHTRYVKIAGVTLEVDLAITPTEQAKGLSGRKSLDNNQGMLFIFDHPGKYFFWMKDMNFPIDIIWIGGDMRVIYMKKNAMPESYLETYGPEKDALYVLEVAAGFSEKNNIKEGDRVEFTN